MKETKKVLRLAALIIILIALIALIAAFWEPVAAYLSDPKKLAEDIKSAGAWGIVIFSLLNCAHVISAIIPAGPFSMAAGLVWGTWLGTFICLISATVIAVILFVWIKRADPAFAKKFSESRILAPFEKFRHSEHVAKTMLLIFLIPGSPKDFLVYFSAFLDITVPEWIVINLIGRFPGIFLTCAGVSGLKSGNIALVVVIIIAAILFYFVGKKIKSRLDSK